MLPRRHCEQRKDRCQIHPSKRLATEKNGATPGPGNQQRRGRGQTDWQRRASVGKGTERNSDHGSTSQ